MDRRAFIQLTASTMAMASAGGPILGADHPTEEGVFPFGAHIYREPSLPLEQLRDDMPLLKRLGFNMVKIQESWAVDEPVEGNIDLSRVLRVVSDARDNGLKVYFGITMEQAPAWLWNKYPDAYLVYNTGEAHYDQLQYVLPADGKPGPCWHHPDARTAAARFIETVGRQVGQYDNVLVWNVWQEIGFWPMLPGKLGFCYCPYSLRAFREWLQARYGTVQKLNQTWRSSYGSFDLVTPPRVAKDLPPYLDFRYFMEDVYLPWVLHWKAEALRRSDPQRRPVFAHADSATIGSGQQWLHARALDFYGCSNYPAWTPFEDWDAGQSSRGGTVDPLVGQNAEMWNSTLLRFDYLRCATPGGRIWAAEFQGGPIVKGLHRGRVPGAADINRWVLASLAAGVQGLCFWNHRAEIFWREESGFGLLDSDTDTLTPRMEAASRLAIAIQRHANLFSKGAVPQAQVAILVSEELYQFQNATFHAENFAPPIDHMTHTIRGMYKSLWDEAIPVDFLHDSELEERGVKYKVVILPFPSSLSPSLITNLCAYVKSGGVLVSEACPGRLSEFGFAAKGGMPPALQALFGVTFQDLLVIREPQNGSIWTGRENAYGDTAAYRELRGTGDFQEYSVMPAYLLNTFSTSSATTILRDQNRSAGTVNTYGSGGAYLIGTLLGHATLSYDDSRNSKFLAAVLSKHGVVPDRVGKLQRRRRIGAGETAWFLFNTTAAPIEETVQLENFSQVSGLLETVSPIKSGSVQVRLDPMSIRCLILRT